MELAKKIFLSTNGRVVQGGGLKTHYRKDARVRTPLRAYFYKIIYSNTNFIFLKFIIVKIQYMYKFLLLNMGLINIVKLEFQSFHHMGTLRITLYNYCALATIC